MGIYGLGETSESTAGSGSASINSAAAAAYTFTDVMKKVIVQNATNNTGIKVKWNGTASATSWDVYLDAYTAAYSPDGINVASVGIFNGTVGTLTYGTSFNCRGWS